jgi:hypothetical protein
LTYVFNRWTILLVVAAFTTFGQQAARPEFQVASIKPNTAVGARGMGVRALPGGRLTTTNAPLMMLIQNAYSVQASQVVGGPSWINSDGYDIEAKPESNTDREHMWLMLQSLLADRFKLTLHRETRELRAPWGCLAPEDRAIRAARRSPPTPAVLTSSPPCRNSSA